MKISFIIPAYNEEECLAQCLDSILQEAASGPGVETEIIVVNNASTDRTRDIALSYPEVTLVDEPRKGLVHARCAGANAASGELLAHVDADCRLTEGWLKTVAQEFSRSSELVALSGPYVYYDLSRTFQFAVKIYYFFGLLSALVNQHFFHIGALLQGGNFVVKTWAWHAIESDYKKFEFYGEDTLLAKMLAELGNVKFTFRLPMYTSGRRMQGEGVALTAFHYAANYLSVTIFKRPFTRKHKDIRVAPKQ